MITKDAVLFVDDEIDAVDPLMRAFQHEGFEVHYVPDGKSALDKVRKTAYSLILMDVMMPGLNGYETLHRLRQSEDTAYIPVIFLTGHFNAEEIVKGLDNGAVDAISKPFHIAEVLMRSRVRMAEAKLKRRFTPVAHFFAEAQEKEVSKRAGVFEFFDKNRAKIGEIYVSEGKVVYATSKDAIKEDAFLQLASTKDSVYLFNDHADIPKHTLAASITGLILEASKILDELEAREIRDETQKRVLVIDKDRIPRILASRALKGGGYATMVTSPGEITQETLEKFGPDVLVLDHTDSESILGKLKLSRSGRSAIPVVIYSDHDSLDKFDGVKNIGSYSISSFVSKTNIDQVLPHTVYQALREKTA